MGKIERLESQLEKLINLRKDSMRRNDFYNMSKATEKIKEVEAEIKQLKELEPVKLSEALAPYGEDVKNRIYKVLLECSLVADLLNDCSESVKDELKKVGLSDFHFRNDLIELCRISQKIASLVIIPGQQTLTDMLTDNAEYIDGCHALADKHLKERLHL